MIIDTGIQLKITVVDNVSRPLHRAMWKVTCFLFRRFLRRNKGNQARFISHARLVQS